MNGPLYVSLVFFAGATYGSLFALWLCSHDRAPTCLRIGGYRPRRSTKRKSPPTGSLAVPAKPQPAACGLIVRTVQLPRAR